MKGAGDFIERITRYSGIKWVLKITGIDCGCDLRQEKLNVKIPFNGSKQDI